KAGEIIRYHGGARISTIYSGLVNFLAESGYFHKLAQKDLTQYLKKEYIEVNGKWYFKEDVDVEGKVKPIDFIPVHQRVEFLIRSYLKEVQSATLDDILSVVFMNLINSNYAEYEEITEVLKRICEKSEVKGVQRKHWKLKTPEHQVSLQDALVKPTQKTLVGGVIYEETEHDLIIKQLVEIGAKKGLQSHIGKTEQNKYRMFRKMSIPMQDNVQFGINKNGFDIIKEIDVLWIKDNNIISAFEVEKSTSIDSGINRFRNLFASTPNLNIKAYIVIPEKRENEAKRKLGSIANIKDGLHKKIKYLLFSDIMGGKDLDLE
ncbi:MAG: hypothetical protein ACE5J9_11600, partial [Methanosarcinales archaeon]